MTGHALAEDSRKGGLREALARARRPTGDLVTKPLRWWSTHRRSPAKGPTRVREDCGPRESATTTNAARRSPRGRESVANGCARRSARGRIRVSSSPKGSGSNVTIRQRHDRRRLAHVSWDLIRPSSWGLGQRGSRGSARLQGESNRHVVAVLRQRATGRQDPNQVVPTMTT